MCALQMHPKSSHMHKINCTFSQRNKMCNQKNGLCRITSFLWLSFFCLLCGARAQEERKGFWPSKGYWSSNCTQPSAFIAASSKIIKQNSSSEWRNGGKIWWINPKKEDEIALCKRTATAKINEIFTSLIRQWNLAAFLPSHKLIKPFFFFFLE